MAQPILISVDPLTAGITLLTLIGLILIAWWQLRNMNKTSRAALLDQLNGRWSTLPIKEARQILSKLIRDAEEKCKETEGEGPAQRQIKVMAECGNQLNNMRVNDAANYSKVLDVWAFFETVGYLAERKYVRKEDVFEIYAGPLVQAWEACENHIRDKRPLIGARQDTGTKLLEHFERVAQQAAQYLTHHQRGV